MGRSWKKAFPNAESSDIRKFLSVLVEAFSFRHNHKLKFDPTDTFIDIYRSVYWHPWMADDLEQVDFCLGLEEEFGKTIPTNLLENDVTLGQLFNYINPNANKTRH